MDKESLAKYASFAFVIFAIFFQYNLFVTPQEMEKVHREILEEVSEKYMTRQESLNLKEQLSDMQKNVDKIYDVILGGND